MTFASVDWIMSLDPHWFSTIFGFIFVAGQGLAAFALVDHRALDADATRAVGDVSQPRAHFLDLGKLLLAFVMLWAYFSFSQFLIIWSGNLPEEIPFFFERLRGGWQYVSAAILLGHFALPFTLLLSRDLKRRPQLLAQVAVCHPRDPAAWTCIWLVEPMFDHERFPLHWMDIALPVGARRRVVVPVRAPAAEPAAAAAERSVLQGGVRA